MSGILLPRKKILEAKKLRDYQATPEFSGSFFSRKGPPFPLAHFYDLCLIFTIINHTLCSLDLKSPKGQCVKVWVLSLGLLKCNRNRRGNIQCRKSSGCYWTWKIEDIMGYPSWFASLSPPSTHHNRSGFALSHILGMTCNHRSMTG